MNQMKKTVLVIDDEIDLCALIRLVFMRENFRVECATSLAEAALKLPARPDIILLDNNLPDGLGIEFYHNHPRAFEESYNVMMSADGSERIRSRAKKEGIDEFIQKPFTIQKMKDIISKTK